MTKKKKKETAFTLRADGRVQTVIRLPHMKKPKYFYGKDDADLMRKIALFNVTEAKGRLLKEIADEWQNEHYESISYNTARSYDAPCADFVAEFGEARAADVSPQELQKFVNSYAKKGHSKKTVKNVMSVMRMIFNHAIIKGDVDHSPMEAIKLPLGLASARREMPTDDEIAIIKKSVDLPFGLYPYFLIYTGCRPGEALGIRFEDIHYDNKTISIGRSIYHIGNKPHIKLPKTENGIRETILLDRLAEKLPVSGNGYLFGDETPISKKAYSCRWNKYLKLTGLKITPYQLRHAFATMLYEAEIDEKEAQRLMGHVHISTTKDIYTHIRQKKKGDTFERLNNYDYL